MSKRDMELEKLVEDLKLYSDRLSIPCPRCNRVLLISSLCGIATVVCLDCSFSTYTHIPFEIYRRKRKTKPTKSALKKKGTVAVKKRMKRQISTTKRVTRSVSYGDKDLFVTNRGEVVKRLLTSSSCNPPGHWNKWNICNKCGQEYYVPSSLAHHCPY